MTSYIFNLSAVFFFYLTKYIKFYYYIKRVSPYSVIVNNKGTLRLTNQCFNSSDSLCKKILILGNTKVIKLHSLNLQIPYEIRGISFHLHEGPSFAALRRGRFRPTCFSRLVVTETKSSQVLLTLPLNPLWLTGFVDGEGCFSINFYKDKHKIRWNVKLVFNISLHIRDIYILEKIKYRLGVGRIYLGSNSVQLRVDSLKDWVKIIEYFDKFPLITQKRTDYELLKKAFYLLKKKEHLTIEGLRKIVALRLATNRRRISLELESDFSNITSVERPDVQNVQIQDPNWIAGFTAAEGCFYVNIAKSNTKIGWRVQLWFKITQHIRDKQLMNKLIKSLGCGIISEREKVIDFRVTKFADIENKIIPFFNNYPILGVKSKDFSDFVLIAELMKENKHLTKEGLEQIKKIKVGMNTGRKPTGAAD